MRRIEIPADAIRRAAAYAALVAAAALGTASPAWASAIPSSHGQLLHLAPVHATLNATTSSNWAGYDQGSIEQGGKLFNSITGEWTVPKVTSHASGQAASSSDWIGIGGGCVDSGCDVTDQTLIQTGTEQDVDAGGAATYSAWWEEIPAPSEPITSVTVRPGDRMYASVAEAIPDSEVWTITLKDLTSGQSFTTTVPYSSTQLSAEWIEETPLVLGTDNSGFAALPSLTSPVFDLATANGAPAKLSASEEMDLVDSNGNVIGAPSAPGSDAAGFNVCAWASTCLAPGAGKPATGSRGTSKHATTHPGTKKRHTTAKRHRKRRPKKHKPKKKTKRTHHTTRKPARR